ncbi:hypothetical protein B0J13DRAFT_599945 [Dactylonectria estremocensis]|uniref:Uncharacterized protein n=1 Tax=Dactylonectria estremocensis TaxID=1079267 RepID=A0A9P9ICN0_9HYPO|nr:hypothetical protein B0J13DRAFT_599945 [Dactylonectria estremocensis]
MTSPQDPHTKVYSHINGSTGDLIDRLAFIDLSKEGKANGVFIMHRECRTLVKLSPRQGRALGKLKATITQRFDFGEGFQFDVDCDCRYIFFCERDGNNGWKVRFIKLFYKKDKVIPVNGHTAPHFSEEELAKYPVRYRFLGAAQARLGYKIDTQLPTASNELRGTMYAAMEKWLDGEKIDLFWEKSN